MINKSYLLIVTQEFDEITSDVLEYVVNTSNYSFLRLNIDDVAKCFKNIRFIHNILYIDDCTIGFIWFRRHSFKLKGSAESFDINFLNELNHILYSSYYSYKIIDKTLGAPFLFNHYNRLNYLSILKNKNLDMPETIVTNYITDLDQNKTWVRKNIGEVKTFINQSGERNKTFNTFFTPKIGEMNFNLFQEYIESDFEIRCLYVKGNYFAIAQFSKLDHYPDIRVIEKVREVYFILPYKLKQKLNSFFRSFDLDFCLIDILKFKNKYFIIDLNPMGQSANLLNIREFRLPQILCNLINPNVNEK